MLLMVEKGIRGAICHAIHQYPKANNKHNKDYNINKKSWHLKYQHVKNLYGLAMSQKLPLSGFKWAENTFQFSKNSDERYVLEVDVQFPEESYKPHNDFPFLTKIMKMKKLIANLKDKKEHAIQ